MALALGGGGDAIAVQSPAPDKVPAAAKTETRTIPSGIGGMAWLDDRRQDEGRLLVVHDTKVGSGGPRIGVLRVRKNGPPTYRQAVVDWSAAGGESNDLEAIVPLPGRRNEFLALESGYYREQYGRLIRLRAQGDSDGVFRVATISAWKLPTDTVSLEGLACVERGDGKYLVIVGERGGDVSAEKTSGKLRWTDIDIDRPGRLTFGEKNEMPVRFPTSGWANPKSVRGCADLHLDAAGDLWCVAAEDPGDAGPFRSVIFRLATVDAKRDTPVRAVEKCVAHWTFDGAKIEALAAPLSGVGVMSIATDDENYGALWRPLAAPSE